MSDKTSDNKAGASSRQQMAHIVGATSLSTGPRIVGSSGATLMTQESQTEDHVCRVPTE